MKTTKTTMTVGIILTIVGVLITLSGIVLIKRSNTSTLPSTQIETTPTEKPIQAISSDKQKGEDFEKYVVQKFSKNYFSILEWTGDKYVNGSYSQSNTHPDLALKFKFKDVDTDFAVECKYRSDYYKNGIEWCTSRQLENYRNYAKEKSRTVFVVIGVGGEASAPGELFVIPLTDISENFLPKSFLNSYRKENFKESNMFYNYEQGSLR